MATFDRTEHIKQLQAVIAYLKQCFPNPNRIQQSVIYANEQELRFWVNHEQYLKKKTV